MEELSRSKRQPLQAASMLELELLRQQVSCMRWTGTSPSPGEARACFSVPESTCSKTYGIWRATSLGWD